MGASVRHADVACLNPRLHSPGEIFAGHKQIRLVALHMVGGARVGIRRTVGVGGGGRSEGRGQTRLHPASAARCQGQMDRYITPVGMVAKAS